MNKIEKKRKIKIVYKCSKKPLSHSLRMYVHLYEFFSLTHYLSLFLPVYSSLPYTSDLISCSLLPEPVPGMVICYVTIPGISASQPVPPMSLYLSLSRSDSHLPPHQQCPVDPMEFDPRSPPSSTLLSCLIR